MGKIADSSRQIVKKCQPHSNLSDTSSNGSAQMNIGPIDFSIEITRDSCVNSLKTDWECATMRPRMYQSSKLRSEGDSWKDIYWWLRVKIDKERLGMIYELHIKRSGGRYPQWYRKADLSTLDQFRYCHYILDRITTFWIYSQYSRIGNVWLASIILQ